MIAGEFDRRSAYDSDPLDEHAKRRIEMARLVPIAAPPAAAKPLQAASSPGYNGNVASSSAGSTTSNFSALSSSPASLSSSDDFEIGSNHYRGAFDPHRLAAGMPACVDLANRSPARARSLAKLGEWPTPPGAKTKGRAVLELIAEVALPPHRPWRGARALCRSQTQLMTNADRRAPTLEGRDESRSGSWSHGAGRGGCLWPPSSGALPRARSGARGRGPCPCCYGVAEIKIFSSLFYVISFLT